jgi:hypothetical protein
MHLANQAAQRLNHDYIGTEHILLGLVEQGKGVAVNVLKKFGIDLADLRRDVENLVQHGPHLVGQVKLPQTPRARKAIQDALAEARRLGHDYVGTEHILLGLIRDEQGIGGQVLLDHGLRLEPVRAAIVRSLGENPPTPTPSSAHKTTEAAITKLATTARLGTGRQGSMYDLFTERARKVMQLANQEARRFGQDHIGTEHVLLGLIKERSGVAASVLQNLGVGMQKVRCQIERLAARQPDIQITGSLRKTERTKNVIAWAIDEADRLSHNYIGTEHILIGLMREQEGIAAQVLMSEGLKLEEARAEVIRVLASDMRSILMRSMPAPLPIATSFEDLPEGVTRTVEALDVDIDRITSEKEEAVAAAEFQKAAVLRDKADHLRQAKRKLLNNWMTDWIIDRSWLSANDGAVMKLAGNIREERSWDLLPALADALEVAGCADREILHHCRAAESHSNHCWVVELLFGKCPIDHLTSLRPLSRGR